jgi:two-component system sensor kinase FixL
MSWVTILWSMSAAACLTVAGIHFSVWLTARREWGHLLFSLSAVGAAGTAACELLVMRAVTIEGYGAALWWAQLPLWVLVVSIVWFTRSHLRAGRPWLAWTVTGMRTLVVVLNLLATPNINFKVISGLRRISFLGESVSMAEGTLNPWGNIAKLSSLLLLVFLVDASVEVWRRGERWRAALLGGSMVLFITAAAVHSALVERNLVHSPYLVSFAFLGTILFMGHELSRGVYRASQLDRQLQATEAVLRESEEQLTAAAEVANVGIWHNDLVRNHIWASARWRTLFGFSHSEPLEFNDLMQRLHPEDRQTMEQALGEAMAASGRYDTEFRVMLPNGQVRWIGSHGHVEFNRDGKAVLTRGASLDITARKEAELEAQHQRNELAHLSRVTMLGALSGSLAHELNQPLAAILSNAQAAQRFLTSDSVDLEEVRDILTDIVEEDKRAGEVIRRLRLLLEKGEVQHQRLDVNTMVLDGLRLLRSDLVNQGVTVHTELAPGLPSVQGDRVQLQQVLLNLVVNACDAMTGNTRDDRRISIRTEPGDDNTVCLSVGDSGAGIAPAKLEQVFEPFFTTKAHGMGLGLAVCRTIVTAHRGRLWVVSNPERGATFHVVVPGAPGARP